jgi:hypothetical protein
MISYLDAGTGSMIVTALAGGFAGLVVAVKMGMARMKAKVTGKPSPEKAEDTDASNNTNQ